MATNSVESVQERFERYWSKRWEWELKRGFASPYSLRKVNGVYVSTLVQLGYSVWCDALQEV